MAYPQLTNQFAYPHTQNVGTVSLTDPNLVSQLNQMPWGAGAGPTQAGMGRRRKYVVSLGERKEGYRVPVIDKKLSALKERCVNINVDHQEHCMNFVYVPGDVVVEQLGEYNPMYNKRPKKLAFKLLNAMIPVRKYWNVNLMACGLTYDYPELIGVRASRERTSAAGLALLNHWYNKFKPFRPFYDAFVDKKDVGEIRAECFDLFHQIRPVSFREIDRLNIDYKVKWEAKQYRLEQKRRLQELKERSQQQAYEAEYQRQVIQNQMLQSNMYSNQLGQAMMNSPKVAYPGAQSAQSRSLIPSLKKLFEG